MQDARASQDGAVGPPAPEEAALEAGPARLVDQHGLEVAPRESRPLGSADAEQPSWLPAGLALLGFAIIAWTLLRNIRRRAAAAGAMERQPAERLSELRERSEAKATVEGLMADALELTQRLAAQLDAKAERIEQLLDRAERRLGELEAAESSRPAAGPAARWAGEGDADRPMPRLAQVGPETGWPGESVDPLHRQVYRLSDEGLDVLEISRRLDQPRGQVELILALRRA